MSLILPRRRKNQRMINVIKRLGLTSGLKLCLDAGDADSYTSGQKWLDRSGNGYDFDRGTDGTSQSSDPTFNGAAGGQSALEYWSFDGGDYFEYDTANEAWMNNIQKNNAKYTLAAWVYVTTATSMALGGNYTADPSKGCWSWGIASTQKLEINIFNTSGDSMEQFSSASVPTNQWSFLAVSVDEAANTGTMQVLGTQNAIPSAYTSPMSTDSDVTLQIGAGGAGIQPLLSGTRMANHLAWEGVTLTAAQLTSIFEATKGKFGL